MSSVERLKVSKAPKAIGSYSQMVQCGDLIFSSGQIALNSDSQEIVGASVSEQTKQIMKNISALLASVNLNFSHLVKVTIYLKDMESFSQVDAIYASYLNGFYPARSTVEVSCLPKNALVEIWHCNTKGEYDNDTNNFHQRAKWFTNENGEYEFTTILPGKYLNGRLYRPAHIHFRVSEEKSKELISQIYFKGDPHITEDPWASQEKAELRVLPISLEDTNGNLAVNFDIYLGKA